MTEATLLGGPPRLIATQSPWLLLSGLGLLFTLALAASVLARATKSRGILGRLGLVVLASFWVRLFFGRFAQVGTPLELFIVGCLTAFVLELMTWFATKAPPNAVPRLLGFVTVGASLPGACLFALTIPWSSARSLGGLELATSLFFLVCLGLLAYVRARAGYRVVRPVDPWI